MILVTGATGHLGSATLEFLLKAVPASGLAALARDPAKAAGLAAQGVSVRLGDYTDYPSLVRALQGVDKVLLVSAVAFTDRLAQHTNVINAAKEAGVKHVVYTSLQRKNDTLYPVPGITDSDIATEQVLRNSGLAYTVLKNGLYTEALPLYLGANPLENGVTVPIPAGHGRVAFVARHDLAEATANVLTQPGHENREYTLTGAEALSFSDVAGMLVQLADRPVAYQQISPAAYLDQLTAGNSPKPAYGEPSAGNGFPRPVAEFFGHWMAAFDRGVFAEVTPELPQLLGRHPTPVKDFLRAAYVSQAIAAE